ncbi:hypothetical protein HDU96_002504 [Phlyctochytrium bullatum]|nr:hypothetical protein HDU96_002504 [Phlyctochytrium bullatum]
MSSKIVHAWEQPDAANYTRKWASQTPSTTRSQPQSARSTNRNSRYGNQGSYAGSPTLTAGSPPHHRNGNGNRGHRQSKDFGRPISPVPSRNPQDDPPISPTSSPNTKSGPHNHPSPRKISPQSPSLPVDIPSPLASTPQSSSPLNPSSHPRNVDQIRPGSKEKDSGMIRKVQQTKDGGLSIRLMASHSPKSKGSPASQRPAEPAPSTGGDLREVLNTLQKGTSPPPLSTERPARVQTESSLSQSLNAGNGRPTQKAEPDLREVLNSRKDKAIERPAAQPDLRELLNARKDKVPPAERPVPHDAAYSSSPNSSRGKSRRGDREKWRNDPTSVKAEAVVPVGREEPAGRDSDISQVPEVSALPLLDDDFKVACWADEV